jgi:hypothetical protein
VSRAYVARALREIVTQAARRRCGYCLTQELVVGPPMEIEHIVPEALGGRTEEANLWLACSLCNEHKGARVAAIDPLSGETVALFHPRRQVWSEHLAWSPDGTRVGGRTPAGRATVVALSLNRPPLVRSRRAWVRVGWHPPTDG